MSKGKEYIEREATCKDCIHYCVCKETVADENWDENAPKEVREMFSPSGCENYMSAADVVEVRHGFWEEQLDGTHYCSECGHDATYTYDGTEICGIACPFCGAQMDGKGEGE